MTSLLFTSHRATGSLPWIGGIAAVVVILVAIGTAQGRRLLASMFKGQSVQTVAQAFADQMAVVEAAYNVSQTENKRLEEKVNSQNQVIKSQGEQIKMLTDLVQSRAAVDKLAEQVAQVHRDTMQLMRKNHDVLVSFLTKGAS